MSDLLYFPDLSLHRDSISLFNWHFGLFPSSEILGDPSFKTTLTKQTQVCGTAVIPEHCWRERGNAFPVQSLIFLCIKSLFILVFAMTIKWPSILIVLLLLSLEITRCVDLSAGEDWPGVTLSLLLLQGEECCGWVLSCHWPMCCCPLPSSPSKEQERVDVSLSAQGMPQALAEQGDKHSNKPLVSNSKDLVRFAPNRCHVLAHREPGGCF